MGVPLAAYAAICEFGVFLWSFDMFRNLFSLVFVLVFACSGFCGDWSQWHGPRRDNLSPDTGLMKSWPAGGPDVLWSVEGIGKGYSTVSISDGYIYITGIINKKEGVISKISLDGKKVWRKPYAAEWYRSYGSSRTTPTINDGCAYLMSGLGEVVCIDIQTGQKKWSLNTFEKYKGRAPFFGVAESLFVDQTKVYCMAGGKKASYVALNKKSGKEIWTTKELTEKASYCSPILIDHYGKKQLVTLLDESFVGIDIADGTVLWKLPKKAFYNPDGDRRGRHCDTNTPIYKDGCVFISTGYDQGCARIRISKDSSAGTVLWRNYDLDNHHGGIVLVDGKLYGAGWDGNTKGDWVCVDWQSGKTLYIHNWDRNKGSLTYADGMLYCYAERTGNFALVKADPAKFDIVSSFTVTYGEDEHWAHPVVLDGRLYVRHGDVLKVYDVKK